MRMIKKDFVLNTDRLKCNVIGEDFSLFEKLSEIELDEESDKKHGIYIEELEGFNIKELGFKIHLLAKYEDSFTIKKKLTTYVKRIVMSIEHMDFKQIGKLTLSTGKQISGFFEFENSNFYSLEGIDIRTGEKHNGLCFLNYILSGMHLRINSFTTLELALDTNFDTTRKIKRFIRDVENYDMFLNGKRVRNANAPLENAYNISAMTRLSVMRHPTLYFKNSKKTLRLKTYNKTREIEGNAKDYINEWNEFDSKTFRVETTISWDYFKYEWLPYVNSQEISKEAWKQYLDEPFSDYLGRIVDLLAMPEYKLSLLNFCFDRQLYFVEKRTGQKLSLLDILS